MNLLLLEEHHFLSESSAVASARQSQHIISVLRAKVGDHITIGQINGNIGSGIISGINGENVRIDNIRLTETPPPPLPITLILAMPRPQMLKRIVQTAATMGVEKIIFLQTSRVEKSFWQSPSAQDRALHDYLILGLEQGMATQLPKFEKHTRFRPFMEDTLRSITSDTLNYIAHPGSKNAPQVHQNSQAITLAIGPEGGFLNQEVEKFIAHGFNPIHLGRRILKVETAVPVLLAKLYEV